MISKRYAGSSPALGALMFAAGLIGMAHDGRHLVPFRAAGLSEALVILRSPQRGASCTQGDGLDSGAPTAVMWP